MKLLAIALSAAMLSWASLAQAAPNAKSNGCQAAFHACKKQCGGGTGDTGGDLPLPGI